MQGQVALVTGASRGIGAATAEALAAAGAHVVLTARDGTRAGSRSRNASTRPAAAATIAPLDLAEPDAIARLAAAMAQRWQALDVLVRQCRRAAAAHFGRRHRFRRIRPDDDGQRARDTSPDRRLRPVAARQPGRARHWHLKRRRARPPRAYWGAYAASKAAFEVLLDCYAQETAKVSKLRVAIVNPGATRTAMRARAYPGEDPATLKPPEAVGAAPGRAARRAVR